MLVVMLWRKWMVVSMDHFLPTANAAVYPRPRDAVARTEEPVELIVRALGKAKRVLVLSHGGPLFSGEESGRELYHRREEGVRIGFSGSGLL
jgi:hypothetical protein